MKPLKNRFRSYQEESTCIVEENIIIPEQTIRKIRSKLSNLQLRSPANSSLKLYFKQQRDGVFAELSIKAIGKSFQASLTRKDPMSAYIDLEQYIDHQLKKWKEKRFKDKQSKYLKPLVSTLNSTEVAL